MSVYNNCSFIGRLSKDLELKSTTGKGTKFCKFQLAVKRPLDKDRVDFPTFVAWGKTAEYINQYAKKGDMVAVTGEFQTGSYENSDKVMVYTGEFNVSTLAIMPKGTATESPVTSETVEESHVEEHVEVKNDEEAPF